MTNGEKIKELYPRTPTGVRLDVDGIDGTMTFTTNKDWWEAEYEEPTTKNDLGVDCVSRQAVDSLVREYLRRTTDETIVFYEHFLDLPSVTPQPRKGHWIYDYTSADGHRVYHCSECGCYLKPKHSEPLNSFKWCSLCGADMREIEE